MGVFFRNNTRGQLKVHIWLPMMVVEHFKEHHIGDKVLFERSEDTYEGYVRVYAKDIKSKARRTVTGKHYPARNFTSSSLYQILRNVIYTGKIEHKEIEKVYDGQHDAIITEETWQQSQAILKKNPKYRIRKSKNDRPYLLKGLLRDPKGYYLTPTFTKKKDNQRRTAQKRGFRALVKNRLKMV